MYLRSGSVFQFIISCLFSLEIFNKKLSRYPEGALYARHGSRSRKNIVQARERLQNAVAVRKGRRLSMAASHKKISKEHQNNLPSDINLEGKLSSKYYPKFTG